MTANLRLISVELTGYIAEESSETEIDDHTGYNLSAGETVDHELSGTHAAVPGPDA